MKITLLNGKTFDFAAELGFNIKVIKSSLAKRLSLRVDEKNRLPILTIPRYCSNTKALTFVKAHHDWIRNMLFRLPNKEKFQNGSTISIAGQNYTICHNPLQRGIKIKDYKLLIGGEEEFLHRRTKDFIKKQALQHLTDLSITAATKINCIIHKITLKDTKSRWGSCSNKNNINYNWRIIMAPQEVINYLVCHEVSHLAHPNHSKDFWNCVEKLCPDWRIGRQWLKIKGKELYRFE